eukprot:15395046-Heterocapsa_arctica.AAC.1
MSRCSMFCNGYCRRCCKRGLLLSCVLQHPCPALLCICDALHLQEQCAALHCICDAPHPYAETACT